MDFASERYVRLYIRDTIKWKKTPWQSKALLPLLMRKLDRAGRLPLDGEPIEAVAFVTELPDVVVSVGLPPLLDNGTLVLEDDVLVMPNFAHAQTVRSIDALRKQQQRDREAIEAATLAAEASPDVTSGHQASPGVTKGHRSSPKSPPVTLASGTSGAELKGTTAAISARARGKNERPAAKSETNHTKSTGEPAAGARKAPRAAGSHRTAELDDATVATPWRPFRGGIEPAAIAQLRELASRAQSPPVAGTGPPDDEDGPP